MSTRTRAVAVLIAVLLLGCLLGFAGLRLWQKRSEGGHGFSFLLGRRPEVSTKFAQRLQLTAEQQAQLKVILEESRRQIDAGRAEMDRKMEGIRADTNRKIAAILTPDQRTKFEQFLTEAGHQRTGREAGGHGQRRSDH